MEKWFNAVRDWVNRRLIRAMGGPRPFSIIFGGLGIGLITEGLSKLLDAALSGGSFRIALLTSGLGAALLLAVIAAGDLRRILAGFLKGLGKSQMVLGSISRVPRHRGLIVMPSPTRLGEKTSADYAVDYHLGSNERNPTLEICWLIIGPGDAANPSSSSGNAEKIKTRLDEFGVKSNLMYIEDADNPKEVFDAVKKIKEKEIELNDLSLDDVIADYTGGTKSMSTGMALACVGFGLKLQMMKPKKKDAGGRAETQSGSVPVQISIDYMRPIE